MRKEVGGMGFRDLQAFNLALLAKQGWKFIEEPSSLVTRVFQAKYFPQVDFIDANLGHNPSYCWHSLWCSQSLLKEGLRWRISDGSKINIWRQPWLRDEVKCLQSAPMAGSDTMTMKDLRTSDLQDLTMDLLHALLTPADLERVLKVPFPQLWDQGQANLGLHTYWLLYG